MNRSVEDIKAITRALLELAAAARDTTIDAFVIGVYTRNLEEFEVGDIVAACRTLESEATWFPKTPELKKAVRAAKADRERRERQRIIDSAHLLPMPQVSEERKRELLERIRRRVGAKVLPEWEEAKHG